MPEHILDGAELLLGVKFPQSYRELVRVFHGASIWQKVEVELEGEKLEVSPGFLLTLDPYLLDARIFEQLHMVTVGEDLEDYMQLRRIIPIMSNVVGIIKDGDWVCLDYRDIEPDQEPRVVYWFRELSVKEGIVPIAETFDAFLNLLK